MSKGYGNVSNRMQKYFKHLDDKKEKKMINKRVRIVKTADPYLNEIGRIVTEQTTKHGPMYGVVFDWDVSSIPVYFDAEELEEVNESSL